MNRPPCACVAPGAYECYSLRHRHLGSRVFDDPADDYDDDSCECHCHERDEDGFTAWQDETERKAILLDEAKQEGRG